MTNINPESLEEENRQKQGLDELKKEFKRKMILYIEYNLQDDVTYFDNEKNLASSWQDFLNSLSSYDKERFKIFLNNEEKSSIELKLQILQISIPIVNLLRDVIASFERDFIFNDEEKSILEENLKTQNQSSLKELFHLQTSRQRFLRSIGLESVKTKENDKEDEKLLGDIFGPSQDLKDRIASNPDLMYAIKKLAFLEPYKVSLLDLDFISGNLDENGKRLLVNYFIPRISLKEAVRHGFLSNKEAFEIVRNELKSRFNVDGIELDKIASRLDMSYFFVQTSSLSDAYRVLDYQEFKLKIINDINALKEEIQDEWVSSFRMFKDAVSNNKNISREIKDSLPKLVAGNYIRISGGNLKRPQYFYVKDVEWGSELKTFLFVNVTLRNGISKNNRGYMDARTYGSFIRLLEAISLSRDGTKIEFLTRSELGEIEEIPDEEVDIDSKVELKRFLDEIDPKGSHVPVDKMAFYGVSLEHDDKDGKLKEASKRELFYVKKVTDNEVILNTGESFSLSTFAYIFKLRKCERFERIDTPDELLEALAKENSDFRGLIVDDDGKIKPKSEKGNRNYPGITYFVGEGDDSYFIDSLQKDSISFYKGEYKEGNKRDKPDVFIGKQRADRWGYTEFYSEIRGKKLKPKKDFDVKNSDEENIKTVPRKRSLFKSWFSMWSIAEMISGAKQIISSIEHSLKTGSKLRSAKFALALGRFLPEGVRHDLQATVEIEEKKTMDDLLSHLTSLDSKVMIRKIEKIITNKSSHQYEIEAALAAMYSKYGTLYNGALSKYRGTFIWYEALGGRVGDALYVEVKRSCEESKSEIGGGRSMPKPFTEEYLIERLLEKQASGDLKPKRRSKIHKEMGAYLSQGIKAELENGAIKAGNQITLQGRIEYCLNQLKGGGYANGLGALEKIWAKGGQPEEMHAIPFIITITGISKYFPEELLVKLISTGWGTVYTELIFNKDASSLVRFKKGMRAIVRSLLGDSGVRELDAIGTDVSKAYKFWSKYGSKLIARVIGKDGYIFVMKDKDEDIGNYYNFISGMQNDDGYVIGREDIESGLLRYGENSLIYTMGRKLAREYIVFNESGRIASRAGAQIFDTFLEHLKKIKEIDYLNDDEKFELFFEIYSILEPVVRAGFGGFAGREIMLNSPEVRRLRSYGIDLISNPYNIPEDERPTEDTVFGYIKAPSYKEHVRREYERFKNINFDESEYDEILAEKSAVRYSIDDILSLTRGHSS